MKRIISTFLIALAAVALTGTNVSFAKEESVKSIEIVKYPSKCAYNVGEGYSTEGMVVKATLSNKKKVEVSNSEITSFSGVKLTEGRPFENEGWKGVTLTYKNVNTFYGITVFDPAKEYFIQFDSDGGTQIESIKIDASTKEFKLPVPKKKSAAFLGWYHSNGNKYTTFTSGMGPALSFKAKWGNSIKFNANGGSGKKIKNGIISSDYKLPKSTFKKSGYKFIGWGRKKTVINQNEFFDVGDSSSFINTDKNITLYA
ncbi:MAG: InlB B-repeat-containing protein, partial [Acetivibrio sp.]